MPIADRNRIYDGWFSLEGGVDAGRAPELIDLNQCVSAENMTFRGGKPTTRPGFRLMLETFAPVGTPPNLGQAFCYGLPVNMTGGPGVPPGATYHPIGEYADPTVVDPTSPVFLNQNSEYIYRNGVFQGAIAFSPHNKSADCIMAMIGGRLFRIIPGTPLVFNGDPVHDAQTTVPTWVDEIVVSDNGVHPYMRNDETRTLCYMVQADKYLLIQDGQSRCIIYDAATARRANLSTTQDNIEIPVGTIMAYGMGRVCVVVNERDIAFGDLYGSHNLPDPADSIIIFSERTFLAGGFDAAIPFQQGQVTGLAFFPQLDTSTGNGQLLAFAERGAAAFFLSLDRTLWQTSQFQILALLTTGLRGHRSISVVNEDLWFRSDDGVRSYRQARSEPSGWAHIPLSTNVGQFFDNDVDWMTKYVSGIYFDNRVLITTTPMPNQGRPIMGGMCVCDFDNLSSFGAEVGSRPAWEGHWTFPAGVMPMQVLTGTFNNVRRAFAYCLAPASDGTMQNALFELSLEDNDDWLDQPINWELVTRALDFQKFSQQSTAFNEIELYDGDIWMSEILQ